MSIDSKSLHHEAKAAGIIYQAVTRHEVHAQAGFEWNPVGERSGMAEIAGVAKESLKAWSQRSTRLREWAKNNLVVVDGEPTAAQIAAAQKATRPPKPETLAWEELKEQWRADERGLKLERDAHFAARDARRKQARTALDRRAHCAHGSAHRQGRVHARRHGRGGRRATARATRPAIRARSSSRSSTTSRCASAIPVNRTTAKGTKNTPSTPSCSKNNGCST